MKEYLSHGGNYQPNFGYETIDLGQAEPKHFLYDMIKKDPKFESAKQTMKKLQIKNKLINELKQNKELGKACSVNLALLKLFIENKKVPFDKNHFDLKLRTRPTAIALEGLQKDNALILKM